MHFPAKPSGICHKSRLVASQEETSIEGTEEEVRMILAIADPSPSRIENLKEQREQAAEELITGDSDDPPLSDEVVEMLRMT